MIFGNPATVKITANVTGEAAAEKITFDGIAYNNQMTPEEAATQINKIFNIVSREVTESCMKRIITQEAKDNG